MFVEYLWGIETLKKFNSVKSSLLFVEYLWGIETEDASGIPIGNLLVCRIPMRDWNLRTTQIICHSSPVCRIPMRDWNF